MGRARKKIANDSSFEDEFSVIDSAFDISEAYDFDEDDDDLHASIGRRLHARGISAAQGRSASRSLPHDWADFDFGGGGEDPFDSPWR